MLYRYTATETTWDSSIDVTGVSNESAEIVASLKVSNALGMGAIVIHVLLAVPMMASAMTSSAT